jgi:hypothetical protein
MLFTANSVSLKLWANEFKTISHIALGIFLPIVPKCIKYNPNLIYICCRKCLYFFEKEL